MSHYTPEFVSDRKQELVNDRASVLSRIQAIARFDDAAGMYIPLQPDFDSGSSEDSGDSASESQALQERSGELETMVENLAEIDAALTKIEEGTYGQCEASGEWISEERLMAYPAARTCLEEAQS